MRRVSVVAACVFWVAICASANVSIFWSWDKVGGAGVQDHTGSYLAEGSTVQLIYSPDATISPIDPGNPLVPTDGEVVLGSAPLGGAFGPGSWTMGVATYGSLGEYHSGYVYQRVFEVAYGSTPGVGDYYKDGLMVVGSLGDPELDPPPGPSNSYFFDSSVTGGDIQITDQIVPEPATMTLLGVGLAILGLRRKMRN